MEKDFDLRLRSDRLLVEYLSVITGKSASALALAAHIAPTTLNRFISKTVKPKSTLKDITLQKIAEHSGLDYAELLAVRGKITEALRMGATVQDIRAGFHDKKTAMGFGEPLTGNNFAALKRDPLLDQIMGATYEIWFASTYREQVAFERLPDLVRLLYGRVKAEAKIPAIGDIKKRAADMLAAIAMKTDNE